MSNNNDSIGKRAATKAAETAAAMGVVFVVGTILSGGNPLVGAAAAKAVGLGTALGGHGDDDSSDIQTFTDNQW